MSRSMTLLRTRCGSVPGHQDSTLMPILFRSVRRFAGVNAFASRNNARAAFDYRAEEAHMGVIDRRPEDLALRRLIGALINILFPEQAISAFARAAAECVRASAPRECGIRLSKSL